MIGSNEARRWRVDTSARDNPDAVRALEDELGLYRLTASLLYSRGDRTRRRLRFSAGTTSAFTTPFSCPTWTRRSSASLRR